MKTKLEKFRAMLQAAQIERLTADKLDCEGNLINCQTTVKIGGKYARVDVGNSGKYMVVLATGEIFGIKGYGVIHRGHSYGTLDTIDGYNWSGYHAFKRQANAA